MTEDTRPWSQLSAVERSLVRAGLRTKRCAGLIQSHGMALRWEGIPGAPPAGGYSPIEAHALVPEFASTAADLIAQGVLSLQRLSESFMPQQSDPVVAPCDLDEVLRDPATWIWDERNPGHYRLDASEPAHARWYLDAYFAMARSGYPARYDLSEPEQRIMLSAEEGSGMLTGPMGIWSQPDPELPPSERLAEVDELLAPLLPFVRDDLLEVQFRTDVRSDAYTVIPLSALRSAFNGTEIWRDHDDADFFEGAHAVLTFSGYATWHRPRAAR
ncbi:hypothetical protein KDL01_14160 [Actinospica durhamensis]|uniref:Uncharacterized protein n=1 Tax=Actinospica durhamensis TaxID=1508375 RepID=A0A941ENN7_9ACTN|nr:hypothetical protein [Actinospica durhamensis]MBR7834415.1 hypothetical protein [Actinospica durhamensis]